MSKPPRSIEVNFNKKEEKKFNTEIIRAPPLTIGPAGEGGDCKNPFLIHSSQMFSQIISNAPPKIKNNIKATSIESYIRFFSLLKKLKNIIGRCINSTSKFLHFKFVKLMSLLNKF